MSKVTPEDNFVPGAHYFEHNGCLHDVFLISAASLHRSFLQSELSGSRASQLI